MYNCPIKSDDQGWARRSPFFGGGGVNDFFIYSQRNRIGEENDEEHSLPGAACGTLLRHNLCKGKYDDGSLCSSSRYPIIFVCVKRLLYHVLILVKEEKKNIF